MIYIDCTPKEWSEQTGLKLEAKECLGCKEMIFCDIPVAMYGYRGFVTAPHGCKETYNRSVWTPIGETAKKWKEVLG